MQLRSGTTTGGTAPRGGVPEQIQFTSQPRQVDGTEVPTGESPGPRTPTMTPQVYTAGTYVAHLRRTPSEPANFRPAQFSFLPQPDYRPAGEPSEAGDVGLPINAPSPAPQFPPSPAPQVQNQPAAPAQQNPFRARDGLRTLAFEVPMRPLDVQRDMYLDYTTTQAIKFYNKGCEKLSGELFNGKKLLTWLVQVQDKANMFTWTPILTIKRKVTDTALHQNNHGGCQSTRTGISGQSIQGSSECRKAHTVFESIHLKSCI
jgi:hypothetical protein